MSTVVLRVMQEWADAIRGDWSDLDGRSIKYEVEGWITGLEGCGPQAQWTVEQWRAAYGLCPRGEGHWSTHCRTMGCADA